MKSQYKIMPIEKGVAAKIYLLAYEKPKSKYEIGHEIYGEDRAIVKNTINKLAKEGYFTREKKDEWRHPKWLSNAEPLITRIQEIKKEENIKINEFDKYVLRKLLDNGLFRTMIKSRIPPNIKEKSINAVDFLLTEFETHLLLKETFPWKSDTEIHTVQQWEKHIEKDKRFYKNILKEIKEKHKEDPDIDIESETQVAEGLPYLLNIPKQIIDKCKRISSFGKKYHELSWNIQAIHNTDKQIALFMQYRDLTIERIIEETEATYQKIKNKKMQERRRQQLNK